MEDIFNKTGAQGWEMVAIDMERATFKREIRSMSQAELHEFADITLDD